MDLFELVTLQNGYTQYIVIFNYNYRKEEKQKRKRFTRKKVYFIFGLVYKISKWKLH